MRKKQVCSLMSFIIFFLLFTTFFFIFEVSAAAENPDTTKKNFDLIPFIWTVGIVGGCIAITLSYVSWRKYKGEEKKKTRKNKPID